MLPRQNKDSRSAKCRQILQKHFKYNSFRPLQLSIILNTLSGHDSLIVMATGSGKSLCYQIPPIYTKKPAIVVSPLISLMQNQVEALRSKGIAAIAFNTANTLTDTDYQQAFDKNSYAVIYITPEGIDSKLSHLRHLHSKVGISCIAIDESHCISEWGFDFRPKYKCLAKLRDTLPNVPILALTATATERVQTDIINNLKLKINPKLNNYFRGDLNRTNLSYIFKEKKDVYCDLLNFMARREYYLPLGQGSTIIYCSSVKTTVQVNQALCEKGILSDIYHGSLAKNKRISNQKQWENDELQCIVATIAFGMGIDKSDIRYIIHYGMCDSIEAYYQHCGRAGRDGRDSQCILFWSNGDFSKSNWRASKSNSAHTQQMIIDQTQRMKQFTFTNECRIGFILRYFGEKGYDNYRCQTRCDNCKRAKYTNLSAKGRDLKRAKDFTNEVRHLVKCCKELGQRYGITAIVHVCHGKENTSTNKIHGLHRKQSFGALKDYSNKWIASLSRKVIEMGYLGEVWVNNNNGGGFRGYKRIFVTEKGFDLLNGKCSVPEWVPDSDMVKASKENRTRGCKSSKLQSAFKNRVRRSSQTKSVTPKPSIRRTQSQSSAKLRNAYGNGETTKKLKRSFSDLCAHRSNVVKRRKVSVNETVSEEINMTDVTITEVKIATNDEMKEKLISVRQTLSRKNGMIASQIISNDGIELLDKYRPTNVENLKMIAKATNKKCITDMFIQKFGNLITKWIKKYCDKKSLLTDININMSEDICCDSPEVHTESNKKGSEMKIKPVIPSITAQSKEIYESFCNGQSISDIVQNRVIRRETVEKCLANMIINGSKIDWNKLMFTCDEIKECFVVLSNIGIDANYENIRNSANESILDRFSDSQIDLLIARYIIENCNEKEEEMKENEIDYHKKIGDLIGQSGEGIDLSSLIQFLHISSDETQTKVLQVLHEMKGNFEIYEKNDKYFSF